MYILFKDNKDTSFHWTITIRPTLLIQSLTGYSEI